MSKFEVEYLELNDQPFCKSVTTVEHFKLQPKQYFESKSIEQRKIQRDEYRSVNLQVLLETNERIKLNSAVQTVLKLRSRKEVYGKLNVRKGDCSDSDRKRLTFSEKGCSQQI